MKRRYKKPQVARTNPGYPRPADALVNRRGMLVLLGTGAATVLLVGCGGRNSASIDDAQQALPDQNTTHGDCDDPIAELLGVEETPPSESERINRIVNMRFTIRGQPRNYGPLGPIIGQSTRIPACGKHELPMEGGNAFSYVVHTMQKNKKFQAFADSNEKQILQHLDEKRQLRCRLVRS